MLRELIQVGTILSLLVSQSLAVALVKSFKLLLMALLHGLNSSVVLSLKAVKVSAVTSLQIGHFSIMSVIPLQKI